MKEEATNARNYAKTLSFPDREIQMNDQVNALELAIKELKGTKKEKKGKTLIEVFAEEDNKK